MSANLTPLEEQALVAKLIEGMRQAGGWAGETHIQKAMFFLKHMLRIPFSYQDVLYKHGPYSFDLHDTLSEMRANRIVQIEPRYPYGSSFGPGDLANKLTRRCNEVVAGYSKSIDFVVQNFGRCDVRELERLATAYYFWEESPESDVHSLAVKINEIKPHISIEVAAEAIQKASCLHETASQQGLTENQFFQRRLN